ncbi:MAG: class I SAM-dependent methyltransferase [Thermodesulfobacteriota bacterium]
MAEIVIAPGREKSLLRRHPWVFSGAVARLEGRARPGDTVDVVSAKGRWLGRGAFSPESNIRVRIWTFDQKEAIDAAFFRRRLERALAARDLPGAPPAARRLVAAEADGLPGLIADRYADFAVCQFLAAGVERFKAEIADALLDLTGCAGIYERSDADVREKEGLTPLAGVLRGVEPPDLVEIEEGPARFLVDVRAGHKTGFYLDQRDNRRLVAAHAAGRRVLNCFAYTGGFGVAAALGGAASVTHLETSAAALDLARRNAALNHVEHVPAQYLEADAFAKLRELRDAGERFDLVVLDPPKFADSKAALERACRGYKDVNLSAARLLAPGGLLFTFSCSGLMEPDLFQKVVADAFLDAGRDALILARLSQAPDHPAAAAFPEGSYLKGLLLRVS